MSSTLLSSKSEATARVVVSDRVGRVFSTQETAAAR